MKFRLGFVSNSSSSSFILAIKGELTKENFLAALGVDTESPMYGLAKEISACFCEGPSLVKDDLDYWDARDLREFSVFREKGLTVYHGTVNSDSDNPMECYLREQGFSVNTDKLFVKVRT